MGYSSSIKVLESILNYLLVSINLTQPVNYEKLNKNNLYIRKIKSFDNPEYKYSYREYALTKLPNGNSDPDLTYNISIYKEKYEEPILDETYTIRLVIGDESLFSDCTTLSGVKFYMSDLTTETKIGKEISQVYKQFRDICESGYNLDLLQMNVDKEALDALDVFKEDFI